MTYYLKIHGGSIKDIEILTMGLTTRASLVISKMGKVRAKQKETCFLINICDQRIKIAK